MHFVVLDVNDEDQFHLMKKLMEDDEDMAKKFLNCSRKIQHILENLPFPSNYTIHKELLLTEKEKKVFIALNLTEHAFAQAFATGGKDYDTVVEAIKSFINALEEFLEEGIETQDHAVKENRHVLLRRASFVLKAFFEVGSVH